MGTNMLGKLKIALITLPILGSIFSVPAIAQKIQTGSTTQETKLYDGPDQKFGVVTTLAPNTQFIIIPPKSVIIGKGVTIGKGVLIEGKPWHQIQLPDGQTGYLTGNMICVPTAILTATVENTMGLCPTIPTQ